MKSLPFYIPKAWKRYPFRVEPSRMDHYRGYPPLLPGVAVQAWVHNAVLLVHKLTIVEREKGRVRLVCWVVDNSILILACRASLQSNLSVAFKPPVNTNVQNPYYRPAGAIYSSEIQLALSNWIGWTQLGLMYRSKTSASPSTLRPGHLTSSSPRCGNLTGK